MAKTKKQQIEENPRTVTYLIERQQNQYGGGNTDTIQLQIPEHWEITFSYVNPGESKGTHCVRIYEPMPAGMTKKLRAVIANVTAMRDLGIPYAVKVKRVESEEEFRQDSMGNFELKRARKVLPAEFTEDDF